MRCHSVVCGTVDPRLSNALDRAGLTESARLARWPLYPLLSEMDVFKFRNRIISDYHGYVSSFISISQPRLREFVDDAFRSGRLWPDPLIQLNPTFKPGKAIAKLRRKWPTIPKSGVSVPSARDSSRRRSQYGTRVHPRSLPALCVVLEQSAPGNPLPRLPLLVKSQA